MLKLTGEQLQKRSGHVRAEARRAPVEITYHGRPELVVMSVEDYAILRSNRKLAQHLDEMAIQKRQRIAGNRMGAEHGDLNALMD